MALVDHHRQFHQAAAAVAETITSGQKEQGIRMMDGGTRFANATQEVVVAIKALMHEAATSKHSVADRNNAWGDRPEPAHVAPAAREAATHSNRQAPAKAAVAPGDDWETF